MRAQNLAVSIRLPLYAENKELLLQMAEQAAKTAEIRSVVISAADGRKLAVFTAPGAIALPAGSTRTISQTVEVPSNPLVNALGASSMLDPNDNAPTLLGYVRIERDTADLTAAIRQVILISTSIALVFWLMVSLLGYLMLQKLTRSFNTLMKGIQTLEQGDFTSPIAIESDDEPGRAAVAINNLAKVLMQRSEENSRLQHDRLNLERQMLHAQKLESLGVMAGGIAHDFNNLLQSILGNMELAAMKLGPDSPAHKYVEQSMNAAKRASLLTGSMLTYVGKGLLHKKGLNLNELVVENVDILKTATSSSITTELQLFPGLPFIYADEAYIQQVVMNLITNAAEAIEQQPGIIKLATGIQECNQHCLDESLLDEKPKAGRFVFLKVSDNGCGMNDKTLKRLFDPFFTTKFTGRGLGMSAVIGIMKTHNGALFVESEIGIGTTFKVLFPISETAPPATIQAPRVYTAPEKTGSTQQRSGVALVVDDEKSVLKVCTKMVSLCGYTVISACDGLDAVIKFREYEGKIDVVLMDLTMPNMDGITAMEKMYELRPEARIIIASGFNEDELSERITSQPPAGFVRKPYSMQALETELNRVMAPSRETTS
ncbi:MAG TPA: response regulator [Desulfuromonadales bacterium]|nr:response regulator [Desulfuromonadales bacterium]